MRQNIFDDIYKEINSLEKPLRFPRIIEIELTNSCNFDCTFCSRQIMQREIGFIKEKLFSKIVSECNKYNTGIRFIGWGEPFLHPNILKFIKLIKEYRIPLHITTNGSLLDKKTCECIIESKMDSITISMQGLDKISYKRVRKYNLDLIEENLKKLNYLRENRKNPFITISTTVDSKSFKENEFRRFWEKYADDIRIGITQYICLKPENPMVNYISCKRINGELSINWDGTISCCCGDYDKLMILEQKINDSSIKEMWENSQILKSYRSILNCMGHRSLTLCSKCIQAHPEINYEKITQ